MRLGHSGDHVTVIEREPLPGGLAAGFEIEPRRWLEKFYHHVFRSDTHAIAMIEEMCLADRLEWHQPITATLRDGRFHQLDSPASLLRFSPLVATVAGRSAEPIGSRCLRRQPRSQPLGTHGRLMIDDARG